MSRKCHSLVKGVSLFKIVENKKYLVVGRPAQISTS
jgi:hypothetical protein